MRVEFDEDDLLGMLEGLLGSLNCGCLQFGRTYHLSYCRTPRAQEFLVKLRTALDEFAPASPAAPAEDVEKLIAEVAAACPTMSTTIASVIAQDIADGNPLTWARSWDRAQEFPELAKRLDAHIASERKKRNATTSTTWCHVYRGAHVFNEFSCVCSCGEKKP